MPKLHAFGLVRRSLLLPSIAVMHPAALYVA
jgi:hypothetical protein